MSASIYPSHSSHFSHTTHAAASDKAYLYLKSGVKKTLRARVEEQTSGN